MSGLSATIAEEVAEKTTKPNAKHQISRGAPIMAEPFPVSQERAIKTPENTSPLPKLLVSSEEAGWEGIVVRAYHEPAALEWVASGTHDSSLVLIARGTLHLEQRPVNAPWSGQTLHQGDLLLQPGGKTVSELRWKGLSSEPLHLLYIHWLADKFKVA
jgi:hypothetical protein